MNGWFERLSFWTRDLTPQDNDRHQPSTEASRCRGLLRTKRNGFDGSDTKLINTLNSDFITSSVQS